MLTSPLSPRWQVRTGRLEGSGRRRRRRRGCGGGGGSGSLALSPCAGLGAFDDRAPAGAGWAFWCWGFVEGRGRRGRGTRGRRHELFG